MSHTPVQIGFSRRIVAENHEAMVSALLTIGKQKMKKFREMGRAE
jgi:hypothetical protein